eukprot:gb/GFBE01082918.1/.p1 GENE.gb/GFBE01082918.1/~~gb/GFBE01082918.1/.p1  ORF type:complete len:144 (+),score=11.48 gb/GFBE01082918.1/:1-432(+)
MPGIRARLQLELRRELDSFLRSQGLKGEGADVKVVVLEPPRSGADSIYHGGRLAAIALCASMSAAPGLKRPGARELGSSMSGKQLPGVGAGSLYRWGRCDSKTSVGDSHWIDRCPTRLIASAVGVLALLSALVWIISSTQTLP